MPKYIVNPDAPLPSSMVIDGQNVLFAQGEEIPLAQHRNEDQIATLIASGQVIEVPDAAPARKPKTEEVSNG